MGDVKQAIYGFRGSDPVLMQAVLGEVDRLGGQTDVLEKSWRSRPALINYTNALFVPAFSKALPKNQVELAPVRREKVDAPAVVHWILNGGKKSSEPPPWQRAWKSWWLPVTRLSTNSPTAPAGPLRRHRCSGADE